MMKKLFPLTVMMMTGLMLGLLASCGGAPVVPDDQFYRLEVSTPVAGKKLFPGTMEVDRFIADGLTAGRPIVYSEAGKSYQVKEFHYHFWTQPPTVMLRDELVTYLRRAKISDAVVTPEMRITPDYVVTGKIKRLEKIIGAQPKALLEIELGLRTASGARIGATPIRMLWSQTSSRRPLIASDRN